MLREQTKLVVRCQRAADIAITSASFVLAYFIKRNLLPHAYSGLTVEPNYYVILMMIIIIWYVSFAWFDIYRSYRENSFSFFFINIVKACLAGFMVLTICLYVGKVQDISRLLLGIFLVLNIFFLVTFRWLVQKTLKRIRANGFNSRNIVIVGTHQRAINMIRSILAQIGTGYQILGCLDPDPMMAKSCVSHNGHNCNVLGTMEKLKHLLENNVVDELIFAMPLRKIENADKYIVIAESMGVRVRIIPDWQLHYLAYAPDVATIRVTEFCGVPTLTLQSTPQNEGPLLIKAFLDFGFSLLFLLMSLPLFIVTGICIKIISPGPVFFRQKRLGQNGRCFDLLKFRTMVPYAEEHLEELKSLNECDGPAFKIRNDPRIIPYVGTFLRKTSLDELPQLVNVLRGEMSLVGPRPPIPCEVNQYESWQRRRLSMKPGLTCFWQIAPSRNDLSFDQWMKLDLKYIDNWSLWLDFTLILKTAGAVLTGAGR